MKYYDQKIIEKAIILRQQGNTYDEINEQLNITIPKSTYTGWFKNITIPQSSMVKLNIKTKTKLNQSRLKAVATNKRRRDLFFDQLDQQNKIVASKIINKDEAKIALAMLCLGEASKYGSGAAFYLGSANPKIIVIFIKLLKICFDIEDTKFRFTVQCRHDQDEKVLENYWKNVIGISNAHFYKTRKDSRSVGKITQKPNYMGVLRVDYFDTKIQHELESLSNMIYNILC